jgi:hypothetical protein
MATKKAAKKAAKKSTAKKATKKSAAKKSPAKKSPAKKSTSRSTAAKKAAKSRKTGTRKYSPAAGKQVETEMREMHEGKLKSGRSGKKVTNPKQAIAIALSEARKKGAKVPPNPNS